MRLPGHPQSSRIPIREIFLCAQKNARFWIGRRASVGNPFFTFEYLRQHFRRAFPGDEGAEARALQLLFEPLEVDPTRKNCGTTCYVLPH